MYTYLAKTDTEFTKYILYPEFNFPSDDEDGYEIYSCSFDYSSSLFYMLKHMTDNTPKRNYDNQVFKNVSYFFWNQEIEKEDENLVNYISQTNMLSASSHSGSFVLAIKQQYIGNRIKEGTFVFNDVLGSREYSDDGDGNIISGSTTIGNIFYEHGIVSIYDDITTGSGEYNFSYSCINDIYEQAWNCKINESELNTSTNPTSYISGSQSIKHIGEVYFTTIGLYNNDNELIATARLSNPIKRDFENDLSIKVKLDI